MTIPNICKFGKEVILSNNIFVSFVKRHMHIISIVFAQSFKVIAEKTVEELINKDVPSSMSLNLQISKFKK